MKSLLLFLTITLSLFSCKNATGEKKSANKVQQAASPHEFDIPPMPLEEIQFIFEKTTYVDYIFHKLPFSLSQDNVASVQQNIAMISIGAPIKYTPGCESLGREFFHVDGEIVWEAEVYFNNDCMAYIFHKDGKPIYANAVSDLGITFYTNLLNQKIPTPGQ